MSHANYSCLASLEEANRLSVDTQE